MKILFHRDVPYNPTPEEFASIQRATGGAELVFMHGAAADAKFDTSDVEVLMTDLDVPRDLARFPRLRWIQLISAGANQITTTPIAATDIAVTTASGLHGVPIAQFVTGALLMLVHQFPQLGEVQRGRVWPKDRWHLRGSVLRGQTAGVLGYGSIGRECARQLHALGMRIVALDPAAKRDDGYNHWPGTGDPEGALPDKWFTPAELDAMLAETDVLLVAAPYTPKTAGMIGARELALLRPKARLIMISRGGIVLERALADALQSGALAGAAVDCFEQEPLSPTHFLHDVPNLITTPHMAGAFEGFWTAMMQLFIKNLERYSGQKPLFNQANKRLGY